MSTKETCCFCKARLPLKKMTRVPTSEKKRIEWIKKLGKEFDDGMKDKKTGYICKNHFRLQNRKFRPRNILPARVRKVSGTQSGLNADLSDELGSNETVISDDATVDNDYQPDEDMIDIEEDEEKEDNEEKERIEYAIVDFEILMELILFCRSCKTNDVEFQIERKAGACLSINLECNRCRNTWHWASSKLVGKTKTRLVNLDIASSCAVTGLAYSKISEFFKCIKIPYTTRRSNYKTMKKYVMPSVTSASEKMQEEVFEIVLEEAEKTGKINLAGDGMFDTPGHCAEYCKYSLIDVETNFVVDAQFTKKKKGDSSKAMEPITMEKALYGFLKKIEDSGTDVKVSSLTTDRDPCVAKLLEQKFPLIQRHYDAWHYVRNLQKSLWKKEEQVQMLPVKPWIRALTNHLYHAISTSKGDGEVTVEKFMSFFLHIQNKHSRFTKFQDFKFRKIRKCEHKKLKNTKAYLDSKKEKDRHALKLLFEMSTKAKRLEDLQHVSPYFPTSQVESFNSVSTLYHPKNRYFQPEGFDMRSKLSMLHWNSLKLEERIGTRTKKGRKSHYSKSLKRVVWNDFFSPATHVWRREILEDARKRCLNDDSFKSRSNKEDEDVAMGEEEVVLEEEKKVEGVTEINGVDDYEEYSEEF